jgi:glycosyltransferase involved in cell wall biosynthesis
MQLIPRLRERKKIAVLFPAFFIGGAESVALAMLDSLKSEFDLTVVTFAMLDFDNLNRLYSTNLKQEDFKVVIPYAHTPLPSILTTAYNYFTARQHLMLRYFKVIKDRFDLVIGAYNEMDFGRPGIQYLNAPMFGPGHEKARALLGYPDSTTRRFYHRFFERLSGFSTEGMKSNLSVANSAWTARLFERVYQMEVGVLYPPVVLEAREVPWEQREPGFVCISRIVPEKQIERAIDLVSRVRAKGFNVHLHIVSSQADPSYRLEILRLQSQNSDWVFIEENLSRIDLVEILSIHRYGLHVRENEQFGISVAEMVKAGCIPFVPNSGGPAEILGEMDALKFSDVEDGSGKICSVLSDRTKERTLLVQLVVRKDIFSINRFRQSLQKITDKALSSFSSRLVEG